MNKIKSTKIKDRAKELFLKANYYTNQDLMKSLQQAQRKETSPIGKHVLQMIIENNKIA
ncbi:unnamed protein product [marine sediment metagenome]|uniref:Fe-S hydro-lyase tartrate dehydratase alpha-type catalytic domain-containing protein n=1 Tax=marine sediment metagenome TaxID=412755 RepID=X0WYD3_9ZZZZ